MTARRVAMLYQRLCVVPENFKLDTGGVMEDSRGRRQMRLRFLITLVTVIFSSSVGVIATGETIASASGKSCYSTCPSTTSLTASSQELTYGNEQVEVFTASVAPRITGTPGVPGGTVTIKWGWTTLCTITLSGGTGSCSPSANAIPGGHRVDFILAYYGGSSSFWRSFSRFVQIKVDPVTSPPPKKHHHDHWPWWF